MKPEWPLYGLGALMAIVVGVLAAILDWSDQTTNMVCGAGLAVLLFTYLPRMARRRDRQAAEARSARGH